MEIQAKEQASEKSKVLKVAVTGGPCGGKTSLLESLDKIDEIKGRYVCVPVAATMLLPGFLAVRSELVSHDTWQNHLQRSVTATQLNLEAVYEDYAANHGLDIVICDRGLMDAPVYAPDGLTMLQAEFGLTKSDVYDRYDAVLHLESLATAASDSFSSNGNSTRYESVEQARGVELRTRDAWQEHPSWHFIGGDDLRIKCETAARVIINLLDGEPTAPLYP